VQVWLDGRAIGRRMSIWLFVVIFIFSFSIIFGTGRTEY
jgi:hypothetical protein